MRIGLYGIRGTYNFGCEAIVRGTFYFINKLFPEAQVYYFSYSYDYDKKALADLKIEIIPIKEKNNIFLRGVNRLLDLLNVERRIFPFDLNIIKKNVDLIFSIGGDIYTIPLSNRKNKKYKYYNSLVDFCDRIDKPIVVYGASVGPWGDYKKAIDYYIKNLRNYKLILCREMESLYYLNKIGLNNCFFSPDPAFVLGEQKNNRGSKIGVNLSPLSYKEVYGNHIPENYIVNCAKIMDEIYIKTGRELLFIPHVISNDLYDNDLLFLRKIKDKMEHSNYVTIVDYKFGFMGIKEAIRDCFIVISARMHCAINAIEENVPTIFLSYSSKSLGMCRYIYENDYWVINISEVDSKLIPLINEMCNRRDEISLFLNKRNIQIKNDYSNKSEMIYKILKN